ncbi:MAG: tetratricopeptide repeat protein [Chloroflexi bacterium]|nr:MAG: tetratricopeptide repeat protein [Chloroflexota bacterium]
MVWTTNVRPVIADVYFNSGQAYADQGNPGAGIALYLDALKLQSDVDIYYLRLSEAYAGLAETATDAQQKNAWFEAAREAAWRAWQLNPEQTYHELNLAHVYLLWAQAAEDPNIQTAALDQAAPLYADASRVLRYDPKLFREWGLVLQLQGDREGALAQYRTSLNLDDKQADTYRLLGYLYRDLGKLTEAEQALEQAAKLKPNRVDVYVTLGEIYESQGRLEEALASAQKAVGLAPRDYRLHLNLGLVYREMGRTDEAAEAVRRALTYAPEDEKSRLETLLSELEGQ